MGILEGLGRIIAGKPVFTVEDTKLKNSGFASDSERASKAPRDEAGDKLMPVVRVPHVDAQFGDDEMVVLAEVLNDSEQIIYVDRIEFLGQTTQLDRELAPGHGHAFEIYSGPALTEQPPVEADVVYRLQAENDYFQAHFQVDFGIRDGHYVPGDFHLNDEIRDI